MERAKRRTMASIVSKLSSFSEQTRAESLHNCLQAPLFSSLDRSNGAPNKDKVPPPSSKPTKSGGGKQKKKKWSKEKQKEKVNNMVLFDQAIYDKLLSDAPKFKLITHSFYSLRPFAECIADTLCFSKNATQIKEAIYDLPVLTEEDDAEEAAAYSRDCCTPLQSPMVPNCYRHISEPCLRERDKVHVTAETSR
ncbi:unnamed protein product [Arabis nemorensis]|uniref:40S ribosomal protein S25 n=1 Tax=Arabis nemorensis TaxID=586526 RepID=A0A565BRN8_9BRAS|nr:unnamed protein product [Arabis nemorensis]